MNHPSPRSTTEQVDGRLADGPRRGSSARRRPLNERRNIRAASIFLLPLFALLAVFQYYPLLLVVRNSAYEYNLINPDARSFVGLDNYVRAFTDGPTLQSMLVTMLFAGGLILLVVPLGLLLAVYLNGKLPGRALLRTMIFLPVVTSSVVVATMWTFMLNQSGIVNATISSFGVGPISFLTDRSWALPAIILMTVWQQVGLAMVLFLGGLQSIPADVEEAAVMDGAGPLRRLLAITIPLLSRTTLMVVVVMTVFALQAFAPPYIMTGGGPGGTTNLLVYVIYRTAFTLQDPSYASAITVILLAFAFLVSIVQNRLLKTTWSY